MSRQMRGGRVLRLTEALARMEHCTAQAAVGKHSDALSTIRDDLSNLEGSRMQRLQADVVDLAVLHFLAQAEDVLAQVEQVAKVQLEKSTVTLNATAKDLLHAQRVAERTEMRWTARDARRVRSRQNNEMDANVMERRK